MKLTKKQFVKYLNTYKHMMEEEDAVIDALGTGPEWIPSSWIENFYQLFSDMCEMHEDDTYGTSLDWYCYETNFGRNEHLNYITIHDAAGVEHKRTIDTPEKLYDLICEESK